MSSSSRRHLQSDKYANITSLNTPSVCLDVRARMFAPEKCLLLMQFVLCLKERIQFLDDSAKIKGLNVLCDDCLLFYLFYLKQQLLRANIE